MWNLKKLIIITSQSSRKLPIRDLMMHSLISQNEYLTRESLIIWGMQTFVLIVTEITFAYNSTNYSVKRFRCLFVLSGE